jgi:hypothetical protein
MDVLLSVRTKAVIPILSIRQECHKSAHNSCNSNTNDLVGRARAAFQKPFINEPTKLNINPTAPCGTAF